MSTEHVTADDVKSMAEKLQGYLSALALFPLLPGGATARAALAAGAAALAEVVGDSAKCQAIATGAEYAVDGATAAYHAFQALVSWLRGNGHDDAAVALLATK